MSISVTFFNNFSKRDNSTATPVISTGVVVNAELKDSTSVLSPTVLISGSWTNDRSGYNYFYISLFDRYYHVTDIVYNRGMVEISGTVDVLASWKSYIGGSTQYIVRAASSAYWNGDIVDTYYPSESGFVLSNPSAVEFAAPWSYGEWNPTLVLGIANGVSITERSAVTYYVLTSAQANALFKFLFVQGDELSPTTESSFWAAMDALGDAFTNLIVLASSPINNIVSAHWFPIRPPSSLISTTSQISVGAVTKEFSVGAGMLSGMATTSYTPLSVLIPKHPQASTRGSFLNSAPFSRYVVDFQPFGRIPIDANLLKDASSLSLKISIDWITGDAVLVLSAVATNTISYIGTYHAKFAVEIPLAQYHSDVVGAGLEVITGAVRAYSGDILGGASSIISGIDTALPQAITKGSQESINDFLLTPRFEHYYQTLVDANDTDAGRPVMKRLTISNLSGYVQCAEGDIVCPATEQEREQIKSYLTGGFYYE